MNIFGKTIAFFDRLSLPAQVAIGVALVCMIGVIDYATGIELNFSIFYLIPVVLVAIYSGLLWGIVISVLSGITWMLADELGGEVHSSLLIFFWNDLVRMGFFIIVAVVFARLKESFGELQRLSRNDSLTGLLNFRAFYEAAKMEIERACRSHEPISVAFLDVDNFKSINDRFGHVEGDNVLKSAATVLRENVRNIDIIGRLGGDEFALIFPETTAESARAVLDRIQKIFERAAKGRGPATTLSVGLATFNPPPDSVEGMMKQADELMYKAKQQGKNRIIEQL